MCLTNNIGGNAILLTATPVIASFGAYDKNLDSTWRYVYSIDVTG